MAIYDKLSSDLLTVEIADHIAIVTLNRPDKRNALDENMVELLNQVFGSLPKSNARVVVLAAAGDHFSAGLDLVEHYQKDRDAAEFMRICLAWHEAFNKMEYAGTPIIAALKGAVVGGGYSWRPLRTFGWRINQHILHCPKASAASSPVAAQQFALLT